MRSTEELNGSALQNGSHVRGIGRDIGGVGAATAGIGAAATTVVAATCCVSPVLAPIIVGLLGAGGAAWVAGLKPYSGYILAATFVLLAGGFWSVYRPAVHCVVGEPESEGSRIAPAMRIRLQLIAKGVLWVAAVLWAASVMLHFLLPQ